ncbi:MAG: hypothetical protein Q9220_002422 [cf. Caloplaca sp. 1 TL-2023]
MLFTGLAALAWSANLVTAFRDTSPFILFSTSDLHISPLSQIASASTIHDTLLSQVESTCPSDTYVVVTQPGARTSDFQDHFAAPQLRRRLLGEEKNIKTRISVNEVLGEIDTASWVRELESKCDVAVQGIDASTGSFTIADDPNPRLIKLEFPPLPTTNTKDRASKLRENDDYLASVLDLIPSTAKYTVIYISVSSSPSTSFTAMEVEEATYEMDSSFSSQHHMEVHRDLTTHDKRDVDDTMKQNVTLPNAPLFEKYQYFTPGTHYLLFLEQTSVSLISWRLELTCLISLRDFYGHTGRITAVLYFVCGCLGGWKLAEWQYPSFYDERCFQIDDPGHDTGDR